MRLLNVQTREFAQFYGENIPPYVITSHRWTDDESSYKDLVKKQHTESKGYKKIEGFCSFVCKDNALLLARDQSWPIIEWIWIDTCCIDQKSSADVSESINSMFHWYSKAHECLAYLADVRPLSAGHDAVMDDFTRSEWFLRGWTLQELLAPPCVIFLTREWEVIGHKCSFCINNKSACAGAGPLLNEPIAETTEIKEAVLSGQTRILDLSLEERLNWMQYRTTTKPEDMAYCLLGVFDVNMPLLYGEGHKALLRLAEEIDAARHREAKFGRTFDSGKTTIEDTHVSNYNFPQNALSYIDSPSDTISRMDGNRQKNESSSERDVLSATNTALSPILVRIMNQSAPGASQTWLRTGEASLPTYYCYFPECARSGRSYRRKADLERHYSSMHVRSSSRLIDCEEPTCNRKGMYGFSRKDKMFGHMREVHKRNATRMPI